MRAGFEAEGPDSAAAMEHAYKFVLRWGSVLAVVLIIVWPLLALAAGSFSRPYFYFWVIISIIWGLVSTPLALSLSFLSLGRESEANAVRLAGAACFVDGAAYHPCNGSHTAAKLVYI